MSGEAEIPTIVHRTPAECLDLAKALHGTASDEVASIRTLLSEIDEKLKPHDAYMAQERYTGRTE